MLIANIIRERLQNRRDPSLFFQAIFGRAAVERLPSVGERCLFNKAEVAVWISHTLKMVCYQKRNW